MTMTEHADVLDSTAEDVLVSMWETAEVLPAPPVDPGTPAVWATVPLDGTLPLLVGVSCGLDVVDRVARHLFGADVGPEDRRDAIGELANLVAGRVKTELCPGGSTGLPVAGSGPAGDGPDGPGTDYALDGAWLRLTLQLREG